MLDENFKQVYFKLMPTSSNIIQHIALGPTYRIQQFWMMLDQHVGFVYSLWREGS
jgi:hypothetical protein